MFVAPATPPASQDCSCANQPAAQVAPATLLDRSATLGDLATLIAVLSAIFYVTRTK